jgi:hypothetical protein
VHQRDRTVFAANTAPLNKTRMIKEEKRCAPARRFSPIFGFVLDFVRGCQSTRRATRGHASKDAWRMVVTFSSKAEALEIARINRDKRRLDRWLRFRLLSRQE